MVLILSLKNIFIEISCWRRCKYYLKHQLYKCFNVYCNILCPTDTLKTNQKILMESKNWQEYDNLFHYVYHNKVETIMSLILKSESLRNRLTKNSKRHWFWRFEKELSSKMVMVIFPARNRAKADQGFTYMFYKGKEFSILDNSQ